MAWPYPKEEPLAAALNSGVTLGNPTETADEWPDARRVYATTEAEIKARNYARAFGRVAVSSFRVLTRNEVLTGMALVTSLFVVFGPAIFDDDSAGTPKGTVSDSSAPNHDQACPPGTVRVQINNGDFYGSGNMTDSQIAATVSHDKDMTVTPAQIDRLNPSLFDGHRVTDWANYGNQCVRYAPQITR